MENYSAFPNWIIEELKNKTLKLQDITRNYEDRIIKIHIRIQFSHQPLCF